MAKINKTDLTTSTILDRPPTTTVDNTDFMVLAKTDKDYKISATNFANSIQNLTPQASAEGVIKYDTVHFINTQDDTQVLKYKNLGFHPLDGTAIEKARYKSIRIPYQYEAGGSTDTHFQLEDFIGDGTRFLRMIDPSLDSGAFINDVQTLPKTHTVDAGLLGSFSMLSTNAGYPNVFRNEVQGGFRPSDDSLASDAISIVAGSVQGSQSMELYDETRVVQTPDGVTDMYDVTDPTTGIKGNIIPKSYNIAPWVYVGPIVPGMEYTQAELDSQKAERANRRAIIVAKQKAERDAYEAEEKAKADAKRLAQEKANAERKAMKEANAKKFKEYKEKQRALDEKKKADELESLVNSLVEAKLKGLKK